MAPRMVLKGKMKLTLRSLQWHLCIHFSSKIKVHKCIIFHLHSILIFLLLSSLVKGMDLQSLCTLYTQTQTEIEAVQSI